MDAFFSFFPTKILGLCSNFQTPAQRLVKRMTRFFVKTGAEETVNTMIKTLQIAGYTLKRNAPGQVCVQSAFTVSSRCMEWSPHRDIISGEYKPTVGNIFLLTLKTKS